MKQRSLFRKYFFASTGLILLTIGFLGVVFLSFASQYFQNDRFSTLHQNAVYALEATEKFCVNVDGTYKTVITEKGCIYPNLRRWLNNDRRRRDRFFKAMRGVTIRDMLNGSRQPKKDTIDKMLALTGMTYEELFKEDDHERKE